ncbi:putative ABC transport system permease protein [Prosthecobacter fusiformis]|uniref:Putative ABC transport system permease protein n=1 Tax=Prosthecobacter fusiformis TaxID=48464 RepID=A0A4R7RYJ6_9BACT|nr:FtsX-like permease family protein [Prosthecobacter fusiformis]TDU70921.1 putative ABC transport system permease protein [Prosthecobacter fusiformis]
MPSDPRPLPAGLVPALLHPWTWKMAWRDSRTQRLRLLIFSLAIVSGIASLVAIHSLKASVESGIRAQAKELLGSDLQVSSSQPLSPDETNGLTKRSTRVTREVAFPSMMTFPNGGTRLVHVRALDGDYPYYGQVKTVPAEAWQRRSGETGILLDESLLEQFQVKPGDEIELGRLRLKILGALHSSAPRASRFSALAPEAYVRLADVQQSGLIGANSMVTHLLHLEIPQGPPSAELKESVRRDFPTASWRLETPEDRQESLGDALALFQRYLGILALASLALGALGVAGAVQSHINRRVATIAILRCLGAPRQLAAAVYIAQSAALGLLGAILGAGIGIGLQTGLLSLFRDSLPIAVTPAPEWAVVFRTTLAGFAVCCGFALIPILKIHRISPAITLRSGGLLPGSVLRTVPVYLLLTALLLLLALTNDADWKRACILVGGLAAAFALVLGVARGLMAVTRRIVRPGWPYLLRQGISNLHRPGNQTLLFLLSLGLGTFLLLTILLAGDLLQQRLHITQTKENPNLYLIDVQPDQVEGVMALVKGQGLPVLETAPMVTMRIQALRGVPIAKAEGVPRWIANREFRSSYRARLNASETLIAGEWHETVPDPQGPIPVSLEEKIAADMHLTVGDTLTLDVQGVTLEARVTSLRQVDWSRFNLNFFMVFRPGALEGAPGFHVVTTRTPDAAAVGRLQHDLTRDFANVSSIDLAQILETVRDILSKISQVVTLLGGLTLIAALPIVTGTLLNGRDVRLRESVLLRTLGASARQVQAILILEFAALGILAALTGTLLAAAASSALAVYVFDTSPSLDVTVIMVTFLSTTALSILGGLALSRGVTNHPPLEILRNA